MLLPGTKPKDKPVKSRFTLLIAGTVTVSLLPLSATVHAADSDRDYRTDSGSVSESHPGDAGRFRSYDLVTPDSIEKVILCYAKRFGLPEDHSLVAAAKAGFSRLPGDLSFKTGFGHDTDKRRDHTNMAGSITSEHAHITFLHRPDFSGRRDVSISLSSVAGGTSIIVIQPVANGFRKGEDDKAKAEQGGAGQPATRSASE